MNSIRIDNGKVDVSISVLTFREGDTYIVHCPSLDISGYDRTEELARADFGFMLRDWLTTQIVNGTLADDLARHGWRTSGSSWREPSLAHIASRRRTVSSLISRSDYSKQNFSTAITCS